MNVTDLRQTRIDSLRREYRSIHEAVLERCRGSIEPDLHDLQMSELRIVSELGRLGASVYP